MTIFVFKFIIFVFLFSSNNEEFKTEGDKEYTKDSSELMESIKKDIFIFINKSKSNQEKLNTETNVSRDFSLNSKVAIKSHLHSLIIKTLIQKWLHF